MPEYITNLDKTDLAHYQDILAEIRADLAVYPLPLRTFAQATFETLASTEISQVIALLPHWLTDLLPLPPQISRRLGVAHLYGWWYYYLQDELLDHQAPATLILTGHLALLKMVDGYRLLGVTAAPCWAEFEALACASANCHAIETQTHFNSLSELTPERLAPWTVDFIVQRAGPFYFNTIAQLHLAGVRPEAPRHQAILTAVRCFGAVRQIGDDTSDWLDDLRVGHLNYVSAQLMRRLYQKGLARNGLDLDLERLVGYHLTDEAFWAEVEQTAQVLAQQALTALAPYGSCRLQALIENQLNRTTASWAVSRAQRASLRALFSLEPITENPA